MRAASFNIRHGRPPARRGVDHRGLLESVGGLDADVVALQEVDQGTRRVGGVDQPAVIAAATGYDVRFGAALAHDGGSYGLLVGVRGSVLASEVVALPGAGEPRIALVARVRVAGEGVEWTVCCTHLGTDAGEASRQLRVLLTSLATTTAASPALLMGDLNAEADVVLPVLEHFGWIPAATGPTHPATAPVRRIDWVAARRARILGASVPDVRASDHRPVVVDLGMDDVSVDPYPAGRACGRDRVRPDVGADGRAEQRDGGDGPRSG